MRTATVFLVMTMTTAACEFDESGLNLGGQPSGEVTEADAGVQQTQQAVDSTGIPPRLPPGLWYCHEVGGTEPPARSAWVWVAASGGGTWCIQFPLGYWPDLRALGYNDKVRHVRPGFCADVMLYEHINRGGAPNRVYADEYITFLDSWWSVRVSSMEVRRLSPVNHRGQYCDW